MDDDMEARVSAHFEQQAEADREALEILEHKEMRDRFALAVLPEVHRQADPDADVADIANACYVIADAMITRRQK